MEIDRDIFLEFLLTLVFLPLVPAISFDASLQAPDPPISPIATSLQTPDPSPSPSFSSSSPVSSSSVPLTFPDSSFPSFVPTNLATPISVESIEHPFPPASRQITHKRKKQQEPAKGKNTKRRATSFAIEMKEGKFKVDHSQIFSLTSNKGRIFFCTFQV